MLNKWITYGSVGVVSVLAGITIGGGPSAVRSALQSDDRPATGSVEPTTVPPLTAAPVADTTPVTDDPTTTTTEITTTTTTPATTTTAATTSTSTSTTTTTTLPEPVGRDVLRAVVANASRLQGEAGRVAATLESLGYGTIATTNAVEFASSTVFYADGFEAEAVRLAVDAGLDPEAIAPIIEAPELTSTETYDVVFVLGTDRNPVLSAQG